MTGITLLDGSIGQELVKRSDDKDSPLWSTKVMIERAELVQQVHADYFNAGASVATTNTYAVLRDRLEKVGMADQVIALVTSALTVAQAARNAHGSGRIAGAIGPLGASYRPDLTATQSEAREVYGDNVRAMDAGVDFFLIETMSSLHQAETALKAVRYYASKPIWLAVTVDDLDGRKLRSGEALGGIVDMVKRLDQGRPAALLINCSRPEAIAAGLDILRHAGLPYGAYANGFTGISEAFLGDSPTVDVLEQRLDLGPDAYATFAMGWVAQGATIVGGCCEVGPEHIGELARQLKEAGHEIV
jgi:homocysteine S-methyltransferase